MPPLQLPGHGPRCGAVQVTEELTVTALHCPAYSDTVAASEVSHLKLLRMKAEGPPDAIRYEPVEIGVIAKLRGREFEVTVPAFESDGATFVLALPTVEPGDSGFGLWYGGAVIGIALGHDGEQATFAASSEIAKLMESVQ